MPLRGPTAGSWLNTALYRLANKLWLKVADLAALEGDYYRASEKFEKAAQSSIHNNLMKYSVKEWFLKAGICHLATKDPIAAPRAVSVRQYRLKALSSWRPAHQ